MISTSVWAKKALLSEGWAEKVLIEVDAQGNILSTTPNQSPKNSEVVSGVLIPGITNLHSHAHQRAMAGLTEKSSSDQNNKHDSFWSWRNTMYQYLEQIQPDDLNAISCQLYLELLKSGYTGVAEFQYLHHDLNGKPYQDSAQMTRECLNAAEKTGIAFTALPVLYAYGGFGSKQPAEGQKRFINDAEGFLTIVESLANDIKHSDNMTLGIAPHSLRAINQPLLEQVLNDCKHADVVHIHVAEQLKEVEDCLDWCQQRPVEWLLNQFEVDKHWCLIHATHMNEQETESLAASGAVAGLCPTTEANLGDGFFNAQRYFSKNASWGIGSDSHISISPVEELRWLEYGQRLISHHRNVLNSEDQANTGFNLFQQALQGGAQATARLTGELKPGYRADMIVVDQQDPRLYGRVENDLIDSWIFSSTDNPVTDVYVGGVKVIAQGHHKDEQTINFEFKATLDRLTG